MCLDVYRSGKPEQMSTAGTTDRWPHFSQLTLEHGYALGLRGSAAARRGDHRRAEPVPEHRAGAWRDDLALAQALADVATVALLQRRETTQARRQAAQLQIALDSRVLIEQAKGVLAERLNVSPDEAFQALRRESRNTNRKLHDLAHDVVSGDADTVATFGVA